MNTENPTTLKAAKAAGLLTAKQWASRRRNDHYGCRAVLRDAKPLTLKGHQLYGLAQTEETLSERDAHREKLLVASDAEPVAILRGHHSSYEVYRKSDLRKPTTREWRQRNLLTVSQIKERGWTRTAIAKFLPDEPDATRENPHQRNAGAPMKLWSEQRVMQAEKSKPFRDWQQGVAKRREAAAKAVSTREKNMEAAAEAAEIIVYVGLTNRQIYDLARATHGGNYGGTPGDFCWSNRKALNAIRHNLTNYEDLWSLINRGSTGSLAYEILRQRIDHAVETAYYRFVLSEVGESPPIDGTSEPSPAKEDWPANVRFISRDEANAAVETNPRAAR